MFILLRGEKRVCTTGCQKNYIQETSSPSLSIFIHFAFKPLNNWIMTVTLGLNQAFDCCWCNWKWDCWDYRMAGQRDRQKQSKCMASQAEIHPTAEQMPRSFEASCKTWLTVEKRHRSEDFPRIRSNFALLNTQLSWIVEDETSIMCDHMDICHY